jgi:hypothetical protein
MAEILAWFGFLALHEKTPKMFTGHCEVTLIPWVSA